MADIKWIKIVTDIFDDEKILLIEAMPEADSIIVIWFKLLCLAGKQNNSGVFTISDKIPYTEKMLATIFRRKESTVSLALNIFKQYGMVEIIEDTITIPNWGKYQSIDMMQNRRDYMRDYMRDYRDKQKERLPCKINNKPNCKVNSEPNVNLQEEDKEEKNKKKEKNIYSVFFESFWKAYPRRKVKARAYKCYLARLKEGFTDEQLLLAAQNYAKECGDMDREERYIQLPATFLSANKPFEDYLKQPEESEYELKKMPDGRIIE